MMGATTEGQPPPRKPAEPMSEQKIDFAYTVYWTKTAREWDADRRKLIAGRVAALIGSPDFLNNAFERKFQMEGLDNNGHSGASLIALQKVLAAMD